MFVGPRQVNDSIDHTRAVIAWSNDPNEGLFGPDDFSFIFTSEFPSTAVSSSADGLELMRVSSNGNVGIGNFQSNGLDERPTQRLDVDGTARLRQMSTAPPDVVITGVEVGAQGDYDLHYLPIDLIPFDDCDWTPNPNLISGLNDDLISGMPGDPEGCGPGNIGIGTNGPKAKLDVHLRDNDPLISDYYAIHGYSDHPSNSSAIYGENVATGLSNNGGLFTASGMGLENFGVWGEAGQGVRNIGLYGEAPINPGVNYAAFLNGDIYFTGSIVPPSDMALKENIEPLLGAMDIILALNPTRYDFRTEEFEMMHLPQDRQYGFIAQEVEEVSPDLVAQASFGNRYDAEGELVSEAFEYLGVDYLSIIPILTQGIKEQQAEIDNLNQRLADMEAMLLDMAQGRQPDMGGLKSDRSERQSAYELYQNRPNPFATDTEIVWNMAETASCRILVHDGSGNLVQVLQDGTREKGLHSLIWKASDLRDGTYYYSLEVEGELLIKKAVKIQR